jgi:hypothetical protein
MVKRARPLDEPRLVAEYQRGASLRDLEAKHHTSRKRVKEVLVRHGLTIRAKWGGHPDPPYYPDDPYQLLALEIIESACADYDNDRYPWSKSVRCRNNAREAALEYFESVAFLADCEVADLDERAVLLARGPEVLDLVGEKWYSSDGD